MSKMGPQREDLVGRRFGRLVVIECDHIGSYSTTYWRCLCDCGAETIVQRSNLLSGHTTSCGCYRRENSGKIARKYNVSHDMSHSPLYAVWRDMRHRCISPNHHAYAAYGGRGICISNEWLDFENFRDWALNNGYEDGLTIDRINNDDGYYPENCRWTDRVTQQNNRRNNRYITYGNETHTIGEWAKMLSINYSTLWERIQRGNMQDIEKYVEEGSAK